MVFLERLGLYLAKSSINFLLRIGRGRLVAIKFAEFEFDGFLNYIRQYYLYSSHISLKALSLESINRV